MDAAVSIRVEGLRVRRGGKLVLPGIALEVRAGTVTGLLGPSGSGKTTLIRSIVGVQIVESARSGVNADDDALPRATADELTRRLALDAVVIAGFTVLALVLGATTLRRRTA